MEPRQTLKSGGLALLAAMIWLVASCGTLGKKAPAGEASPAQAGTTAPAGAAAEPTATGANQIQRIEVKAEGAGAKVVVTTSQPATYTVYKLPNPPRIILDITDTGIASNVPTTQAINNNGISEVQVVGAGERNKPVGRIVVGLVKDVDFNVNREDGRLVLAISGVVASGAAEMPAPPPPLLETPAMEAGSAPAPLAAEAAPPAALSETPAPVASASAAPLPEPASGSLPPAKKIVNILSKREGNLLRIVVVTDGAVGSVDAFTLPNPPRIVVDLMGLKSAYSKTRLDIKDGGITTVRVGKHPDKVRLVIDVAGGRMIPYTTVRKGDQLIITIGEGAEAAAPSEAAPSPPKTSPSVPSPIEPTPVPIPLPEAAPAPEVPAAPPPPMPAPVPETPPPAHVHKAAPPPPAPEPETPPPAASAPIQPELPPPSVEPSPEAAPAASAPVAAVPVDVASVDFDYTQEKSTVRIETTARAEYEIVTNDRDQLISVRLKNASIAQALERSLDTSEFASPIRMVSSYQWTSGAQRDVYVTLSLNFLPKYYVVREGNKILFIAENPRPGATGAEGRLPHAHAEYAAGPGGGQGAAETTTEEEGESATGPGGAQYYGGIGGSVRRTFSGRVVYLDYQRINVVDALSLLAEVAGLNLVVSGDLKGTVSLKLEAVPWDQALDIILRTQKYGAVIRGNILRVAPLGELEEEERRFQERKKQKKIEQPLVLRILFVSYANPEKVADQLKYVLTPGRGRVEIDMRTNSLLIWDVADNLDIIEDIVHKLDIETPQVLIEARIVEAQDNLTRDIGIRWGGTMHSGAAYGNPTGLNFPGTIDAGIGIVDPITSPGSTGSLGAVGLALNQNTTTGSQSNLGISLGSLTHAINLDLLLHAMELEDKVKVISSPRVLTVDNFAAQITQGVAIPFATTSSSGTQTQFYDANLKIMVLPHVTADRRIIMDVIASNNTPVLVPGASGPGINKEEAVTRILVKDGDTVVIGGLYVISTEDSVTGTPGLYKLPFLGWLFKQKHSEHKKRELLIFITPRIISGGPEYMQLMRSAAH